MDFLLDLALLDQYRRALGCLQLVEYVRHFALIENHDITQSCFPVHQHPPIRVLLILNSIAMAKRPVSQANLVPPVTLVEAASKADQPKF